MMCILTNYVICVPLTDKSADTLVITYVTEVYCLFGGSRKSPYQIMEVNSKTLHFQK